jgi:hypothetical protein
MAGVTVCGPSNSRYVTRVDEKSGIQARGPVPHILVGPSAQATVLQANAINTSCMAAGRESLARVRSVEGLQASSC